jgi:hypothetical protein
MQSIAIANPTFDRPATARVDPRKGGSPDGNITVVTGWYPDYHPRESGQPEHMNRRPEWRDEDDRQKVFTTYGTTRGVIYQRVSVPPGSVLTFTCEARYSATNAGVALVLGIDPTGGTNFEADTVAWGDWHGETAPQGDVGYWPNLGPGQISDARVLSVANIAAEGPNVTLFCRLENLYAGKDASAFWYDARLYADGDDTDPGSPGEGDYADLIAVLEDIQVTLEEIRDKL